VAGVINEPYFDSTHPEAHPPDAAVARDIRPPLAAERTSVHASHAADDVLSRLDQLRRHIEDRRSSASSS
jgi:hypothetical protein